jgi:hypothetical protein
MPRVREETVPGFAWCPNGMCPQSAQVPAEVIRQEVELTMRDSQGDSNQVEKSFEYVRFADGQDHECEDCGRQLEVGIQERPVYPGSNWDPDGLRQLIREGVTAAKGRDTSELDELRAQLAEMQAQIAKQNEEAQIAIAEKQNQEPVRRGPGRPPKQTQEA